MKVMEGTERPETMKVKDAAARLGISESYLYQLIANGRFPAIKLGERAIRVSTAKIDAIISSGNFELEDIA